MQGSRIADSAWLLPVVLIALGLVQLGGMPAGDSFRGSSALDALMLVATIAPLAARRRAPVATPAAILAANVLWTEVLSSPRQDNVLEVWLALVVAVYGVGLRVAGRRGLGAFAVVLAAGAANSVLEVVRGVPPENEAPVWASIAAAFALGRIVRRYRSLAEALTDRTQELERERGARERQAAELERTRIARELHDAIAHALSVIVLHASVEREVAGPAASAGDTLATIEATGREALAELRRVLGLLRAADDGLRPGLERVGELVDRARAAGLDVTLHTQGRPPELPADLDASVYRIVQESLTNALKHAPGARVDVALRYGAGEVEVEVRDDGAARAATGGGYGLIGIRERVRLSGGDFAAGCAPEGGFRVRARLPVTAVRT